MCGNHERPATTWGGDCSLQGYLAYKKSPLHTTLQQALAWGPMEVLGGGHFLMSGVPLQGERDEAREKDRALLLPTRNTV